MVPQEQLTVPTTQISLCRLIDFIRPVTGNPVTTLGTFIVVATAVLAVIAPWVVPFDPYAADATRVGQPPSRAHLFGTDEFGYDVFSRVIWGTRYDLAIALGAVLTALSVGTLVGSVAGYAGSVTDEVVMRIMDILQAFPGFILAMGIAAALGPELRNVILAIGLTNIPIYARLVRSKIISIKRRDYVTAAVCIGNPPVRVLFVHVLPNCLGPIFVQTTLQCGWAILSATGLSFIGLGVRIPDPEWGVMISMGVQRMLMGEWWSSLFPGLAIVGVVVGFNLLGDGLQATLDPLRRTGRR